MSGQQSCQLRNCPNPAEFQCNCQELLCSHHLGAHLIQNPGHKTGALFQQFTDHEKECFKKGLYTLQQAYTRKLKGLLDEKDKKIKELLDQIRDIEIQSNNEVKNLIKCYGQLRESLSILYYAESMPSDLHNESLASLLKLKSTYRILGDYHIETLLVRYGFIDKRLISDDHCATFPIHGKLRIAYKDLSSIEISHQDFIANSRCLYIGDDYILVTGGSGNYTLACLVNVKSQMIILIPSLNNGRKCHSMSFIENKLAVIGGCNIQGNQLNSVEIFENEWKEDAPLNIARSSHTAARSETATYVFGGFGENKKINSIEKNCEGEWKIMTIILPLALSSIGVWYYKNETFILLGGSSKGYKKYEDKVYKFNSNEILELPRLGSKHCFSYNLWVRNGNAITSYDYDDNLITYEVPNLQ